MSFEFLDHTGDSAVGLRAPSFEGLLAEAVRALAALYAGDASALARLEARADATRVPLALEAEDHEALLVDLLNELIYHFDVEGRLTLDLEGVELAVDDRGRVRLRASRRTVGDIDVGDVHTEVKAATFHDLAVERSVKGEFTARVVFDL